MTRFRTSDGLEIGIGSGNLPGIDMEGVPSELEPVVRAAAEPGNQRITVNAFTGLLLPYHIHNINNMLVGVLGNTELASMFLPGDIDRAIPKVKEATEAAGAVTRFLRDLSESTHPNLDRVAGGVSPLSKLGRLISLACGRSVETEDLQKLDSIQIPESRDPFAAFGALIGAGAWSVLCLGGAGTVGCDCREGAVVIRWERPPGSGEPMLPGSEMAATVVCAAGGLAGRAGCLLRVRQGSPRSGSASLESVSNVG